MKDMLNEMHLTNNQNFDYIDLIVEVLYQHIFVVYMNPILIDYFHLNHVLIKYIFENFQLFVHQLMNESNVLVNKLFENEVNHDLNIHLDVH